MTRVAQSFPLVIFTGPWLMSMLTQRCPTDRAVAVGKAAEVSPAAISSERPVEIYASDRACRVLLKLT
jgi:hypothetical protein